MKRREREFNPRKGIPNVRTAIPRDLDLPRELTLQQVVDLTGVNPRTVYDAVTGGNLPARMIPDGRRWAYKVRAEDAVAWSETKAVRGKSKPKVEKEKRLAPVLGDENAEEWTVADVVARTGVSRQAVHQAIDSARLPARKIPHGERHLVRIRPGDLPAEWRRD